MCLQPVVHKGSPFPARMSTLQTTGRRKVMPVTSASVPSARTWSYGSSCKKPGKCSLYFGQPCAQNAILEKHGYRVERELAVCHYHLLCENQSGFSPPVRGSWCILPSTTSCFLHHTFLRGRGRWCIQRGVRLAKAEDYLSWCIQGNCVVISPTS